MGHIQREIGNFKEAFANYNRAVQTLERVSPKNKEEAEKMLMEAKYAMKNLTLN